MSPFPSPVWIRNGLWALSAALLILSRSRADPVRLHPANPHWLEFNGRAVALVTSGEHYGAVVNPDFDFRVYLEALQRDGMNYTRVFGGSYVEPMGAFGIERNTLAPAPGRFLAPWVRSGQPGYAGGGNRFDLGRFSDEYLVRLKTFLGAASRRGIVVELTLFCSTYGESQWALHPFNPTNNIQGNLVSDWRRLNVLDGTRTMESPEFRFQESYVRWLVRELNYFDNLFYEIQNEPWADHHVMGEILNPYLTGRRSFPNAVEIPTPESVAWQRAMARVIVDEESRLPKRHLIAQNAANFRLALKESDLVPEAGILHFHYAFPEAATWNRGLGRVVGCDETGFAGADDDVYRRQAWSFVLSGGGIFNNLDYSFTPGHEDGTDATNRAPGGGGPTLRRQLRVLSEFLAGFDLAEMRPDPTFVVASPGVVARALSAPGKAHAVSLEGRGPTLLTVELGKGTWTVDWVSVEDGRVLQTTQVQRRDVRTSIESPQFGDAIAVRFVRR